MEFMASPVGCKQSVCFCFVVTPMQAVLETSAFFSYARINHPFSYLYGVCRHSDGWEGRRSDAEIWSRQCRCQGTRPSLFSADQDFGHWAWPKCAATPLDSPHGDRSPPGRQTQVLVVWADTHFLQENAASLIEAALRRNRHTPEIPKYRLPQIRRGASRFQPKYPGT